MNSGLQRRVDSGIDEAISERRIVGSVILISLDGSVYRRTAGFADREEGRSMMMNYVFRLASLTKPLVPSATLAYVGQGLLELANRLELGCPSFIRNSETSKAGHHGPPFAHPHCWVRPRF